MNIFKNPNTFFLVSKSILVGRYQFNLKIKLSKKSDYIAYHLL